MNKTHVLLYLGLLLLGFVGFCAAVVWAAIVFRLVSGQ